MVATSAQRLSGSNSGPSQHGVPQDTMGMTRNSYMRRGTGGKPTNHANGINLLTDTEAVIARENFRSIVYRLSSVVIAVCLLAGSLAYAAWLFQNNREKDLKSKIELANQQLTNMSEVLQMAILYDTRLKAVAELWTGSSTISARILGDLEVLAQETSAEVISYTFNPKTFDATFKVANLASADTLIKRLEEKNTDQIWKPISIKRSERKAEDEFHVHFLGTINKAYAESNN